MATALARQLAKSITQAILAGEMAPDTHLSAQKLADKFGVSRTPVREALHLLVEEGFAVQRAKRGFFTSTPDTERENRASARHAPFPFEEPNAYQQMADDWLADNLPAEVSEQMLRERYGLTKAQVGDILMRAAREGWAEPNRGYKWTLLPVVKTAQAFEQAYRFRIMLEPTALLEPDFNLDRAVLNMLKDEQSRMLDADIERLPGEMLMEKSAHFHEELARLSGNPFFHQALVRINRMRRLMEYRAKVDRRRLFAQCTEHLQILELVASADMAAASHAMRGHLIGALRAKSTLKADDP